MRMRTAVEAAAAPPAAVSSAAATATAGGALAPTLPYSDAPALM
jgi:hypothetical protein